MHYTPVTILQDIHCPTETIDLKYFVSHIFAEVSLNVWMNFIHVATVIENPR